MNIHQKSCTIDDNEDFAGHLMKMVTLIQLNCYHFRLWWLWKWVCLPHFWRHGGWLVRSYGRRVFFISITTSSIFLPTLVIISVVHTVFVVSTLLSTISAVFILSISAPLPATTVLSITLNPVSNILEVDTDWGRRPRRLAALNAREIVHALTDDEAL